MTDVRRTEPREKARSDSWSPPSLAEADDLQEEAPRCSLPGLEAGLWAKG